MIKSPQIARLGNTFKDMPRKSHDIPFNKQYFDFKSNKELLNNDIPIAIYNSGFSPSQLSKDFSVKFIKSSEAEIDGNKLFTASPYQQNVNNEMFQSNNLRNSYSDLRTSASFSSIKSSESFVSINNNTSQGIKNNFVLIKNNQNLFQSPEKLNSSIYTRININNNNCFNSDISSKSLSNFRDNSFNNLINPKLNQNFSLLNLPKNNSLIKDNSISDFNLNNVFINNNNKISNESKYFQTQKSIDFSENKINENGIDSNFTNDNINGFQRNNNNNIKNISRKKSKNYYNKFNASRENSMNENTVILTLKIKVGKNDYRVFNLKKYDDLFVSLEKFVALNKIKPELVKPLVSKIFSTLNKIFWLLNNKIGKYDQKYLRSLYNLWLKNNKEIPKRKNKNLSDKSTASCSDSSSESIKDDIKSNSYQNSDGNSSEEQGRKLTSKSF